jgi:riboflavin kinase/FMN adenylyltransferase
MRVIRGDQPVPPALRGAAVALGNFDGVHRGHRKVIAVAMARAAELSAPSGVITFHPHPRLVLAPGEPVFRLTPLALKLRLIEAIGVDATFVLDFNLALAAITPERFVADILRARLGVAHVVAGADYRFGAKRSGDIAALRTLAAAAGFGVTVADPEVDAGGAPYSSSRVREALAAGDVAQAADLLGYRWRVAGEVIGGDHRGRGLGYPTINLKLDPGVRLAHGIYTVRVATPQGRFGGAAYHGSRPTFAGGEPFLEAFLFDFEDNLYGQEVEVEFVDWVREDRTFDTAQALAVQIGLDCAAARARLAAVSDADPYLDLVRATA